MPDPELLREWHPLDHTPAPEYIPPKWDGPHVGKRLAEALRTVIAISRTPRASSVFLVGSRAGGISKASISSPLGCGAMRWRCSHGRNHRAIASCRDGLSRGIRSRGRVPICGRLAWRHPQSGWRSGGVVV
jgi:hypothetical protein